MQKIRSRMKIVHFWEFRDKAKTTVTAFSGSMGKKLKLVIQYAEEESLPAQKHSRMANGTYLVGIEKMIRRALGGRHVVNLSHI